MESELTLIEQLDVIEHAFYNEAQKFIDANDLVDYNKAQDRVNTLLDSWLDLGGLAIESCRE